MRVSGSAHRDGELHACVAQHLGGRFGERRADERVEGLPLGGGASEGVEDDGDGGRGELVRYGGGAGAAVEDEVDVGLGLLKLDELHDVVLWVVVVVVSGLWK